MGGSLSRTTTEINQRKGMKAPAISTGFNSTSVLFTCQYFTHKDFFFFFPLLHLSTLAAVSYFTKLTARNVAGLVTQDVSVTMVTFHIPPKDKAAVWIYGRVIRQGREKKQNKTIKLD